MCSSDLQIGDMVCTRNGFRRVQHAWLSRRNASIVEACFSNGSVIRCTANHRFHTQRGFIPLKSIRYSDILTEWTPFTSKEENTRSANQMATIRAATDAVSSTATYGLQRTVKSILGFMSTTLTELRYSQQMRRIWNFFQLPSTEFFTQREGKCRNLTSLQCGLVCSHGEQLTMLVPALLKELNGISTSGYVKSAEKSSWAGQTRITALENVGRSRLIQYLKVVFNAGRNSKPPNINPQRIVPENAVRLLELRTAGFADVYDLEVEDEHEFFANGVLVHNCRYGLKSYLRSAKTPISVVRAEVASQFVDNGVIVEPTELAMAMRKFESDQRKKSKRRTRWSAR